MRTIAVVLMVMASFAAEARMGMLVAQWVDGGERYCRYDNGTVINVGVSLCPLTIR